MTRREAREHCFKMLFSADFYPDREEAKEQLAQYADGPEEDDTDEEGRLVILHKTNLDGQEAERLTSRVREIMDRIPEIDSQIEKVAINEAVELAKKFGGKDSPAFVNGILARFAKSDQEPEA